MDLESCGWLSQVAMGWRRGVQAAFRGSTWDPSSTKYRLPLSTLFEKGAIFCQQTFKDSYAQFLVTEQSARFREVSVEFLVGVIWSKLRLRRHARRRDLVTQRQS